MVSVLRGLLTFLTGYFVGDTGVVGGDSGRPSGWLLLAFAFVGYLIFKELNKQIMPIFKKWKTGKFRKFLRRTWNVGKEFTPLGRLADAWNKPVN